jgi:hypothetical protein
MPGHAGRAAAAANAAAAVQRQRHRHRRGRRSPLLARYDELVPVLFADLDQPELCHYFLDEDKVRELLKNKHYCSRPFPSEIR